MILNSRKTFRTLFNNDDTNFGRLGRRARIFGPTIETYEGKLIDAHGATGRYVRLYTNGKHLRRTQPLRRSGRSTAQPAK